MKYSDTEIEKLIQNNHLRNEDLASAILAFDEATRLHVEMLLNRPDACPHIATEVLTMLRDPSLVNTQTTNTDTTTSVN